jgi:elongation factor 1-beta
MSQYSIKDESHLSTLDANLKDNLFIGGHSPNAEDALVFEQFKQNSTEPNQETHLNLWSWYALVTLFEDEIVNSWKSIVAQKPVQKQVQKPAPKKEEPKIEEKPVEKKEEKPAEDECDNLFDDEPADDKALEELKKKQESKKEVKKGPIQKSLVIFDVKVWEPQPDDVLEALGQRVLEITMDGLFWKTEFKLNDVAYGVKKITIGCVIEDEKVSTEDIIAEIESWEDDVQSVDIVSFNKL